MGITVPVSIHLDHGLTVEGCKQAVDIAVILFFIVCKINL